MQCACAILSSVAFLDVHYFPTLPQTRHDFRKKKYLLNIKCVFRSSIQILSGKFLILRRNERDMIINVYLSSCKVLVILATFE